MPKYLNVKTKYSEEYRLEEDVMAKLPIMEFAYGSLHMSRRQALIELGFPEEKVDELMEERLAEDLMEDPETRKLMGHEVIKRYKEDLNG